MTTTKRTTKTQEPKTYQVVEAFLDLQDGEYRYNVGDIFPRKGYEPSKARIAELSSTKNKIGKILIKEK